MPAVSYDIAGFCEKVGEMNTFIRTQNQNTHKN